MRHDGLQHLIWIDAFLAYCRSSGLVFVAELAAIVQPVAWVAVNALWGKRAGIDPVLCEIFL